MSHGQYLAGRVVYLAGYPDRVLGGEAFCRRVPGNAVSSVDKLWGSPLRTRTCGDYLGAQTAQIKAFPRSLAEPTEAIAARRLQAVRSNNPAPLYLGPTVKSAGRRSGPEFQDASRGGYELERISLLGDGLASVDLKPDTLKEFILANREALLAEAAAG